MLLGFFYRVLFDVLSQNCKIFVYKKLTRALIKNEKTVYKRQCLGKNDESIIIYD